MFENVVERVEQYKQIAQKYEWDAVTQLCDDLMTDIEEDTYTLVVLGEFSTGKSSFINALIGQPLLPVGITPTTSTINILKYGTPSIQVHYRDGRTETTERLELLNDFIAQKLHESNEIEYVNVFQPLPFLQDRVALVDTPGLNDISATRTEVTYQYLPQADVVFFLLDCRAPLRKSEYDFLTNDLLTNGMERIVFVANFADEVDEEELDIILAKIQRDLEESLPLPSIEVIPFSALEAIQGKEFNDEELLEISGLYDVQEQIQKLCTTGTRIRSKEHRYEQRLQQIQSEMESLFNQQLQLLAKTERQLQEENEKIELWKEQEQSMLQELELYYLERLDDFERMASKSIAHFFKQMEDEFVMEIELFQGREFSSYVKEQLPLKVQVRMKNWLEQYTPQLHILIEKLEVALSQALTTVLEEEVYLSPVTQSEQQLKHEEKLDITLEKTTDPIIASGLIAGGVGVLAMIAGGPVLLPLLGMAGLPYIQSKFVKDQLKKVKPQAIQDLKMNFFKMEQQFEELVHDYLKEQCTIVYQESVRLYQTRLQQQEQLVQQRIEELRMAEQDEIQQADEMQQDFIMIRSI